MYGARTLNNREDERASAVVILLTTGRVFVWGKAACSSGGVQGPSAYAKGVFVFLLAKMRFAYIYISPARITSRR